MSCHEMLCFVVYNYVKSSIFRRICGDDLFVADETTLYGPRVLAPRVSVRRNQLAGGKGLRATVPRRCGYSAYHTPYRARHVLVAADIYSRDRARPTSVVRRPIRVRTIYNTLKCEFGRWRSPFPRAVRSFSRAPVVGDVSCSVYSPGRFSTDDLKI